MGLDIKGLWHKVRALASSEIGAAAPMDSNGKLLSDLQAAEFLQPFLPREFHDRPRPKDFHLESECDV
mgnify:CR=1 FL=1